MGGRCSRCCCGSYSGAIAVVVHCLAFNVVIGVVVVVAGACACSFVIGSASLFFMLEMSACSWVRRQSGLALVASDGLAGAAASGEG